VALIRLLFDLGLRRGEVVAIDLADVSGIPSHIGGTFTQVCHLCDSHKS